MKRIGLLGIIFWVCFQSNAQTSLHIFGNSSESIQNSAATGVYGTEAELGYQYRGNGYSSQYGFGSVELPAQLGVGASLYRQGLGIGDRFSAMGNVSYHIMLGDEDLLYFGFAGGFDMQNWNKDKFRIYNEDGVAVQGLDPYLNSLSNSVNFNLGAGLYWKGEHHFLSFGIPRILHTDLWDTRLYAAGGYHWDFNNDFRWSNIVRLYYLNSGNTNLEWFSEMQYKGADNVVLSHASLGVLYRYSNSVAAFTHLELPGTGLMLGLGYRFFTSSYRVLTTGIFEISLRYHFKNNN